MHVMPGSENWGKKIQHEMKIIRSKFLNLKIYHVPGTYKSIKKKSNPLHILSLKTSQCIIFEIN